MGHVVASLCEDDPELSVVAGIDILGRKDDRPFPVYSTAGECREKADAIIDFSNPAALDGLLDFALKEKIPLVLATTG